MAATAAKPAKRKRETKHEPAKKRTKAGTSDEDDSSQGDSEDEQSRILLLENKILDSKKHYNNIAALLGLLGDHQKDAQLSVVAAVSLCRVFIRLLATGKLVKRKELTEKELVVVRWLRKRLADYKEALIPMLRREEAALTVLTLAMRILKAEAEHLEEKDEYTFPRAFFAGMVGAIVDASVDDSVRGEFTEKYVLEYDDVRFFTLGALRFVSLSLLPRACILC